MENIEGTSPFEFRKPVTGSQFINHNEALDEICSGLGGKKINFVWGYQGYGNTSLALKIVERMERKYKNRVVVYVSLKGCKTEFQLLRKYIIPVVRALDNESKFQFRRNEYLYDKRGIAELPEMTAQRMKKKVVLILDDFDVIIGMHHQLQIEELLNSVWSNQRWISTCVVMNDTPETKALTRQQGRPFYIPEFKEFEGIQLADWHKYISDAFKDNKQSIGKMEIKHLVSKMNGIPKYIQSLSHYVYLTGKSKITIADIDAALNVVVELDRPSYRTKLSQFTKFQKRVLMTVLKGESVDVPSRYAEKTIAALETVLTISGEECWISNPYFGHYIMKQLAR